MKRYILALVGAAAGVLAIAVPTLAAADKQEVYVEKAENLAVQGYDPVAYFAVGAPVKGSQQFSLEHKGATWRFSSSENLEKFKSNPAAFEPQYGGHCAWAVSQGYTAKGDARFWRIVDDKLYLNYNAKVQKDWSQDIPGFIAKADAQWPSVLAK